jgi:hypothetical protein
MRSPARISPVYKGDPAVQIREQHAARDRPQHCAQLWFERPEFLSLAVDAVQ